MRALKGRDRAVADGLLAAGALIPPSQQAAAGEGGLVIHLARAERLYLTRVGLSPEGDAWFPAFSDEQWQQVSCDEHSATADTPAYAFQVYERRQAT